MKRTKIIILTLLSISVFLIKLNIDYLNSYRLQADFKIAVSNNNYDNVRLETILNYNYLYPSITNTAIPIKGIIGRYLIEYDSIDRGLKLLYDARKDSPFIMYPEAQLADYYDRLYERDSFIKYSTLAFNKLPNNPVHFVMNARRLKSEKKLDSIVYNFKEIIKNSNADFQVWKVVLASFVGVKDTIYDDIKADLLNEVKNYEVSYNNEEVSLLLGYIKYGQDTVNRALEINKEAKALYNQGNINLSYQKFIESINLFPSRFSYEDLIKVLYYQKKYEDTIRYFEEYSEIFDNSNLMTQTYAAVSYFNLKMYNQACPIFNYLSKNAEIEMTPEIITACN